MLIPIVKDFNNAFSYLVSGSAGKTKEMFDSLHGSLPQIAEGQPDQARLGHDVFQTGWAGIKIGLLILVQTIQYVVSFQWLRDFAYLPIRIPAYPKQGTSEFQSVSNTFTPGLNTDSVSTNQTLSFWDGPNPLQRFFSTGSGQAIVNQTRPYHDFLMGASTDGVPVNSWSLSFLSNEWFDPLTVPVNFLSPDSVSNLGSSTLFTKFASLPGQIASSGNESVNGGIGIGNAIVLSVIIAAVTGFSGFLNGFFVSFPLSLSNILSLRYLIVQKFWVGCLSILGIVLGEISFMLLLILPPPFIQIALVYLESAWPYVFGLSLIIFIVFDLISNPYTNTMSFFQTDGGSMGRGERGGPQLFSQKPISPGKRWPIPFENFNRIRQWLGAQNFRIFGLSFLLAFTEQSCCFSFFGSLNLSSTANFLDTYLFAASGSPLVLFFSCIGFLIGSFLAITIYNLALAKIIFLSASLINYLNGIKSNSAGPLLKGFFPREIFAKKNWNPSFSGRTPINAFLSFWTRIKNRIQYGPDSASGGFPRLTGTSGGRDSRLSQSVNSRIIGFIGYLPGGKPIMSFLFPGIASKSGTSTSPGYRFNNTRANYGFSRRSFDPLSIEIQIDNALRGKPAGQYDKIPSSEFSSAEKSRNQNQAGSEFGGNQINAGPGGWNFAESSAASSGSALYNKIDKILLTGLITLSFTTIPYYGFDYIVNGFFGFVPQDEILNAHSLRVNFPDYTNLLGITLSDNNSVINTDVSLYDRAHFMYGEWPNSFESLNYQGELMWTNLRDHRRQKRTRRSTRLKFKTLKTKISTSWKEFKRGSGFSTSIPDSASSSAVDSRDERGLEPLSGVYSQNLPGERLDRNDYDPVKNKSASSFNANRSNQPQEGYRDLARRPARSGIDSDDGFASRNTNALSNLFYKIVSAWSPDHQTDVQKKNASMRSDLYRGAGWNASVPRIPEEARHSTRLSETIKPISTSTFIDLSGGEKYIKTYPKNWKRAITEKYYQNPIYQTILSTDLKTFSKREPASQQLTDNQENESYFLRVKMAHYYDSLRFYFSLKEQINGTRSKATRFSKNENRRRRNENSSGVSGQMQPIQSNTAPNPLENTKESVITGTTREPLKQGGISRPPPFPPFQFKSMASMNYRQQFKGTLRTVKHLFAVSLPEAERSASSQVGGPNRGTTDSGLLMGGVSGSKGLSSDDMAQTGGNSTPFATNSRGPSFFSSPDGYNSIPAPIIYKYDKYLFNEYAYPRNEFLHEEGRRTALKGTGKKVNRKPSTSSSEGGTGRNVSGQTSLKRNLHTIREGYRGNPSTLFSSSTKTIYNLFGSNDPFYMGWDQNSRRFVLTSRVLTRSSALNRQITQSETMKTGKQEFVDKHRASSINSANDKANSSNLPTVTGENKNQRSVHIYRPYTSWPFFKHQLKNLPDRPYFVLYENYLNILNKRVHLFSNININDIDTKSLTFLYSYSFNNNVKKYVSQLPINLYKQAMRPTSLENLFTPISDARSSFLWPGSNKPAWEYYFW